MVYHDTAIRTVLARLNLKPLKTLACQPGVQAVFRIVAYYADGRAYHSATTLIDNSQHENLTMESIFVGFFANKAIMREVSRERYQKFRDVLNQVHFDTLYFPTDKLLYTSTLWCIERATGTFSHQLILSPHISEKPYCLIINAIDDYLGDAVREIQY